MVEMAVQELWNAGAAFAVGPMLTVGDRGAAAHGPTSWWRSPAATRRGRTGDANPTERQAGSDLGLIRHGRRAGDGTYRIRDRRLITMASTIPPEDCPWCLARLDAPEGLPHPVFRRVPPDERRSGAEPGDCGGRAKFYSMARDCTRVFCEAVGSLSA
jgi:alkylation response protein AidB-like acyl-CoA dehydrogenase